MLTYILVSCAPSHPQNQRSPSNYSSLYIVGSILVVIQTIASDFIGIRSAHLHFSKLRPFSPSKSALSFELFESIYCRQYTRRNSNDSIRFYRVSCLILKVRFVAPHSRSVKYASFVASCAFFNLKHEIVVLTYVDWLYFKTFSSNLLKPIVHNCLFG